MAQFVILKNQMRTKIEDLKHAVGDFEQQIEFVNSGENYGDEGLNKAFVWLLEKLSDVEKLHNQCLQFQEYCPCGSGKYAYMLSEDGDPLCTQCESTMTIESSGQ